MSMESFGFDFGGELLDFNSWGNVASPNGAGGNLPFSVGTPTGVASLGDDAFGNDADFSFMNSPGAPSASTTASNNAGANAGATASSAAASATSATATATTAATTTKASADPAGSTFNSGDAAANANNAAAMPASDKKVKDESAAPVPAAPSAASSNDQKMKPSPSSNSNTTTGAADANGMNGYAGARPNQPASQAYNAKTTSSATSSTARPANASAGPNHAQNVSSSMAASMSAASASVSTSRPNIDGTTATTAPAVPSSARPGQPVGQERYQPNQMQPNQQPHGQVAGYPAQSYGMNPQGNPMVPGAPGQPPMQQNASYMQAPYRPSASVYDEEMMRVKSMMMQHPDLIPPPVEVLRVSMARSSVSQGMMPGATNYMSRMSPPGQMVNRMGNMPPGYAPVAQNPGMMMQNPNQAAMMERARAQMNQPRPMHQSRTPGGQNPSPDMPTAWQSENDLPLRRRMIGKIVSLLQQRKPDAPAEWIRRLPDMARRLEDSLYRTAKNRDEYGDFSSLKTRLQHLAVTMGARAQSKGNVRSGVGVVPGAPNMMGAAMPPNMAAMAPGMSAGMAPQGMTNMAYGNPMAQQQMQMMQNPQMRQQLTPQQFQQMQAAQMQRRQYQMQQAQQMQRTSMQQQPQPPQNQQYQQNPAMQQQRQNQARGQPGGQMNPQQMQQMNPQASGFMQQQPGQAPNPSQAQGQPAQGQSRDQNQNPQQQRGMNGAPRPSDNLSQGLVSDSADLLNLDFSQSFMNDDDLDVGLGGGDHTMSGTKRSHQMAAQANAAAFKRSKVAGTSDSADAQAQVQGAGGSSKAPSMSTVNAK